MIRPENEAELSAAIAGASGPLRIIGGGTRTIGRARGEALFTAGLSGISLYEPGALTIVAGAGTPLAEVEAALVAENQRLPFEPPLMGALTGGAGVSTIGGVVAANASGPRRIQAGACRDSLIGVRFVDGRGNIIKNGGRVMKNVTGYDLVKLLAGSHGTLGVISEVAFKVLPGVESVTTVVLHGLDDQTAVEAMSAALCSPYEVSGAAHDPARGVTLMRLEGFADSVAYRSVKLRETLARYGDVSVDERVDWAAIRDARIFDDGTGDLWRISVKPSDGYKVGAAMGEGRRLYDWGGGLIWAEVAAGFDLRSAVRGFAGHATLIRGQGCGPVFQPEPAPVATLSQGVRTQFDPRGILNTEIMV